MMRILLMDDSYTPLIHHAFNTNYRATTDFTSYTVFVSRDLDKAMKIGIRIATMEGGRIVQCVHR